MSTSNLKISIAALSLCVSAVAIYIHLPYVIAAVSGSGAIEAVPLAIFAVSAIVALVSVIYLIRLAVSRAGDKKKIDFSGEEELGSRGQQQQNLVEGGRINTWKKTSEDMDKKKEMAELEIEMVKVGVEMAKVGVERAKLEVERTKVEIGMANLSSHIEEKQDSRSQMDVARAIPQNSNASLPSPSGGAPPPPPPPSSNGTPLSKKADSPVSGRDAILNQIRQGKKLRNKEESDERLEKMLDSKGDQLLKKADSPVSGRDAMLNQIRQGKKLRNKEESDERLEKMLDSKGDQLLKKADSPVDIQDALLRRVEKELSGRKERICPSSDSSLSGPFDSNGWGDNKDEGQSKQGFAPAQADASIGATYETDSDEEVGSCTSGLSDSQLDNEKESERPDSGYGPSPLDFESEAEAEKPQAPASLQEEPSVTKVNNVDPVNSEVQEPSTSSLKDHIKLLNYS
ncbi:hypothetical protein HC358_04465 [Wolbachia pipientis]|uniref:WH2 domain-containing protein n=1 Tax=Wolbachia pipientis TaxID=955 RepID=A0A7G5CAP8_WOLPI|nr:WH2 domain-containing protein [Wolbachia pipientis]QMV46282.1 hypothetical protein HC358_04465 [Wolbachia pipientis]